MIKEDIKTLLIGLTKEKLDNNDLKGVYAEEIAYKLKNDRANISRILNSLWKEGSLIKIAGRPVGFFDYDCVCNYFKVSSFVSFIPLGKSVKDYVEVKQQKEEDNKGNNSDENIYKSLSKAFNLSKAAISYPPYGLNTIISGKNGTGKNKLINMMIKYSIDQGIKDRNVNIYQIECSLFSNNFEKFKQQLLGEIVQGKYKKGALQKAQNGFLILNNYEELNQEEKNFLCTIIKNNNYLLNNSLEKKPIDFMIIITTTLPMDTFLDEKISNYFPMKISIDDFDNQGPLEKLQVICAIISTEAKRIETPIRISKDALFCFCSKDYNGNINILENDIKLICSKAYQQSFDSFNKHIVIDLFDLSEDFFNSKENIVNQSTITSIFNQIDNDYIDFDSNGNSEIFNSIRKYESNSAAHLSNQFINEFDIDVDALMSIENNINENINAILLCSDNQLATIKKKINPFIFDLFSKKVLVLPQYQSLKFQQQLLYGILLHISSSLHRGSSLTKDYNSICKGLYPEEYQIASDIYQEIDEHYNIEMNEKEIDYLASYLAIANKIVNQKETAILIIAHGENIASEMVNYVQPIVKNCKLDYINYTKDMNIEQCIKLAILKASSFGTSINLLIMYDVEPLSSISDFIVKNCGINCKSIGNLSLSLLINTIDACNNGTFNINEINNKLPNISGENKKNNDLINEIINKVISKTTIFIDCHKAINLLDNVLSKIIKKLNIPYSNDLAVKFYCHCVAMLERVIKNECWHFNKITKYAEKNYQLMHIIESSFDIVNNSYGIKIPQTELAYICEIFNDI